MTDNSIPDFLRAHKPESPKIQTGTDSTTNKTSGGFMPEFQEHETPEMFFTPENPIIENVEQIDTVTTEAQSDEAGDMYKDASKSRLPRGSKPPSLSLLDAITVITDIEELAGGSVSLDALSQIVKNSRSSSSFQKKVTALRSFGLVETENQEVKVSDLGERIVAPKSSAAQIAAIKEAFLNVEIFAKVYNDFCGKILPQDTFLINTFKDYVPKDLAKNWMEKFKESATYARVLLDRGDGKFQVVEDIVITEPKIETPVDTSDEENKLDEGNRSEAEIKDEANDSTASGNTFTKLPDQKDAIKTIKLRNSGKEIWLGSDANILQIKFGEDMDFVLALIRLFDLYENRKRFEIKEVIQGEQNNTKGVSNQEGNETSGN